MRVPLATLTFLMSTTAFVQKPQHFSARNTMNIHSVSASYNEFDDNELQRSMKNVTSAYMQSVRDAVQYEDDSEELEIAKRRDKIRTRQGTYRVTLPFLVDQPLGISIAQIDTSRTFSEVEFNLDTMQIDYTPEDTNRIRVNKKEVLSKIEANFKGLIVSAVEPESPAWANGVRPGDVLQAVSATLGDSVWPKSTLEGVRSALSSRKAMSRNVVLELKHISEQVRNQYELTLQKPLGIEIQESSEGYVEVTGFNDNASTLVRYAVQIGDRVVAADSALGDRMWPVSTVEGVISACTSRLPGQPVKLKFERPIENMKMVEVTPPATRSASKVVSATETSVDHFELLQRCREVLKKYSASESEGFRGKYDVPAIVADKVVDAIASASAPLDSITLSMIMSSYLSCKQPEKAIKVFEAATGFKGDASSTASSTVIRGSEKGQIVPSEAALGLYTGTALLQAHALRRDLEAAQRVVASMEGRSGELFGSEESAPWPWTGQSGSIKLDTNFYNVALSAAEKSGIKGLRFAKAVFDSLEAPMTKGPTPSKDIVTYNTYISALISAGQNEEAFRVFDRMQRTGIKPDKFTYTALVRACDEDDVQELLYDMKEKGIRPDVIFYNTLMTALCEKRQWTAATRLVMEMESRAIVPNGITYGILMNSFLKAGKPSACLALFESACASERSSSLIQNVHLYTTAVNAASILGDHQRAMELLSRMPINGVKPNSKTLSAAISACLYAGEGDVACKLFEKITSPDSRAVELGIRAHCLKGDVSRALQLLSQNRLKGKQIISMYEVIITSALKREDYKNAKESVSDMLGKGLILGKRAVASIIDSLGLSNLSKLVEIEDGEEEFSFLLFLLDSYRSRNLPIDGRLYSVILSLGKLKGGSFREVSQIIIENRVDAESGTEILVSEGSEDQAVTRSWEALFRDSEKISDANMPSVVVRVAPSEVRQVLRAEQAISNSRSRGKKATIKA